MSKCKHIQNIQEPLDGHFCAVDNQGKWVKNQRKIREIKLPCMADTLYYVLLFFFFFRKTNFTLDQQQVAFMGKYSPH